MLSSYLAESLQRELVLGLVAWWLFGCWMVDCTKLCSALSSGISVTTINTRLEPEKMVFAYKQSKQSIMLYIQRYLV